MIPRIFHPFFRTDRSSSRSSSCARSSFPVGWPSGCTGLGLTGHRPSLHREILLLIFVVYLAGLAAVTLEPNRPSRMVAETMVKVELRPNLASLTCSSALLPRGSTVPGFCARNARGNALLFFPLGILLPLVWSRLRFWRGVQIALALSVGIELVQVLSMAWGSYRTADVNDVILNCLGASLGLGLVSLLRLLQGPRQAVQRA